MSAFRVIEELARIDSAAGWNVSLANATEPFGAWFSDETTEEVFGSPETVMAGAFFPPRRAVPTEGGYRLSGRCSFNSNCHAATWVLGLARVHDDGVERLDDNGEPVTLITLFPMREAEIIDNWDTLGMCGTGSHDVMSTTFSSRRNARSCSSRWISRVRPTADPGIGSRSGPRLRAPRFPRSASRRPRSTSLPILRRRKRRPIRARR